MKKRSKPEKVEIVYVNNTGLDTRGKTHDAIRRAIANGGVFLPEDNLAEVLVLTCPKGVWIVNFAEDAPENKSAQNP